MIRELVEEVYNNGFTSSILYTLIGDNYEIYQENINQPLYAYNFQTKLISKLDNKYYPNVHIDYTTLFDEFVKAINNNYKTQLFFKPYITLNFDIDELLNYDFTKMYEKLNLPQLNCTFRVENYSDYKLGLCLYIAYEDYEGIGDIDEFNFILKQIVKRYKFIILKHYEFIRYDEIRRQFVTDNGLIVEDYFPTLFVGKILLNIDNPEKILINKLLLNLNTI